MTEASRLAEREAEAIERDLDENLGRCDVDAERDAGVIAV
jgi:frataxin-like iron-binding protein CyaY